MTTSDKELCVSLEKSLKSKKLSIEDVLDKLSSLYSNAIESLRNAIAIYVKEGRLPDIDARKKRVVCLS